MDENTKKVISEQYNRLPEEVKKAIVAADYPAKLQEIVKNNKLMIDQAGTLENETTLVLLGLEPLEDYADNLVKNVGLDKNTAFVVAHDVNESVFKSIRESLKKLSEEITESKIQTEEKGVETVPQPTKTKSSDELEVRPDILPEKESDAIPSVEFLKKLSEKEEVFHKNVPPVENIMQAKKTETIVSPKEDVIIEEKSKLPPRKSDPYREPVE